MNDDQDKTFLRRVRAELDHSAASLDELTVARLRAARLQALEAKPRHGRWFVLGGALSAAVAAGVVAFLVLTPVAVPPPTGLDQLELVSEADVELYQELEFYRWLAAGKHAT